jgi:hypothetical protein
MKTLKSVSDILPPLYQTCIIGTVIYVVWVGIDFYLQDYSHYTGRNLLISAMLTITHWPTDLHYQIYNILAYRAQHTGDWGPLGDTGYHYMGYIAPGICFALIGLLVGFTENNPQKEAKRRRALIILFSIAIVVSMCMACIITFFYEDF